MLRVYAAKFDGEKLPATKKAGKVADFTSAAKIPATIEIIKTKT